MRLTEILRLVWINIKQTKSKVLLTSLGIIVGAATIVLVIAIGRGGQVEVENQYKNLNVGAIDVTVGTNLDDILGAMMQRGGGMPGGGIPGGGMPGGGSSNNRAWSGGGFPSGGTKNGGGMPGGGNANALGITLTTDDVEDIKELVPNVSSASLIASGDAAVLGGDLEEETTYTVAGVMSDYVSISNLELLYGDFITSDDQEDKAKTAVIGYSLAQEIFESAYYAQNEVIEIEGKKYNIVGVLSKMGTVSSGISPDDTIYIPYSTALKYVLGSDADSQISVIASDVNQVDTVRSNIEALLKENYPKGSFTTTDAGSAMEAAQASANTLSMLLIAVASIVFIVGGIGIMNVLFVSVKERTNEIGILKALGCSKREILLEFLMEANFMSTFGGIIGVGVGYALIPVIRMLGMTVVALPIGGILAFTFAIITGTVFGFYPAYKASTLTPIKALSQE